ncbi:MAG: rRNA maturation RNase YbeY [Saprospiraceae bacterium]
MTSHFFPALPDEAPETGVFFHAEDVPMPSLDEEAIHQWINRVIALHQSVLGELNYIFCSDNYLHQLNVEYLDHDTLTDIITFPYSPPPLVHGDLYISTERVADNAQDRNLPTEQELLRVMIHGVLHLCGYGDKTPEEAQQMRQWEEEALRIYPSVM